MADVTLPYTLKSVDVNKDGKYEPNLSCDWLLLAPESHQIHLSFTKFDVQNCTNCTCDVLEVSVVLNLLLWRFYLSLEDLARKRQNISCNIISMSKFCIFPQILYRRESKLSLTSFSVCLSFVNSCQNVVILTTTIFSMTFFL